MRFFTIALIMAGMLSGCQRLRAWAIEFWDGHEVAVGADDHKPVINFGEEGKKREKIKVSVRSIAAGLSLPTDLQFVPGKPKLALVAEKGGALRWLNVETGQHDVLIKLPVETSSEQGLLGVAFHPDFQKNRKIYLNYVVDRQGDSVTRVAEFLWRRQESLSKGALDETRTILDVVQPYANHNAGQLAFGPDRMLYIGYGDGGWANDPHGHGQNLQTLLGSMIRIDVDRRDKGKQYAVPHDNPFVAKKGARPEIWAYGLRNPWRFSFDRHGQLIVADVGQNKWEEISVVEKGGNYGWDVMEGDRCFKEPTCKKELFEDPLVVYGREDGGSITGGYVYYGNTVDALKDKYVFADFVSKRVWAIEAPQPKNKKRAKPNMIALGEWDMQIATFGQDHQGELYVLDFYRGGVYKIE